MNGIFLGAVYLINSLIFFSQDLLPLLRQVEVHLSQYKSLRRRMADCGDWDGVDNFVTNLLINKDVSLPGGSHTPAGIALLQAFEKLKVIFKLIWLSTDFNFIYSIEKRYFLQITTSSQKRIHFQNFGVSPRLRLIAQLSKDVLLRRSGFDPVGRSVDTRYVILLNNFFPT